MLKNEIEMQNNWKKIIDNYSIVKKVVNDENDDSFIVFRMSDVNSMEEICNINIDPHLKTVQLYLDYNIIYNLSLSDINDKIFSTNSHCIYNKDFNNKEIYNKSNTSTNFIEFKYEFDDTEKIKLELMNCSYHFDVKNIENSDMTENIKKRMIEIHTIAMTNMLYEFFNSLNGFSNCEDSEREIFFMKKESLDEDIKKIFKSILSSYNMKSYKLSEFSINKSIRDIADIFYANMDKIYGDFFVNDKENNYYISIDNKNTIFFMLGENMYNVLIKRHDESTINIIMVDVSKNAILLDAKYNYDTISLTKRSNVALFVDVYITKILSLISMHLNTWHICRRANILKGLSETNAILI